MRTPRMLALAMAALALTSCGNDTDTEEPTSEVEDAPPMDGDVAPLPDGTFAPYEIPFGEPAYRVVQFVEQPAPLEWLATLTDFHCDVDIDLVNEDFAEELAIAEPYVPRPGHVLCAATISYENIGTVPGSFPDDPDGVISNGAIYQQTPDYSLYIVNEILMSVPLGGPFNPGTTFEAQTLLEVPEGLEVDAVYFEPDDTSVATHMLVE